MPTDDTFENVMNSYSYCCRKISSTNKLINMGRYSYRKDRVEIKIFNGRSISLPKK